MLRTVSRPALAALLSTALLTTAAGCGGGGGESASSVDAKSLLRDAAKNAQLTGDADSVDLTASVEGKLTDPSSPTMKAVDGKATFAVKAKGIKAANSAKELPTLNVSGSVDGSLTGADGQAKSGKYSAGVTWTDKQLYVNWKGKDYELGQALSQQLADRMKAQTGASGASSSLGIDPKKLTEALDVQPDTWFSAPKATDGPEIGGKATFAVGGDVNVKAAADDVTTGLRNVAKTFPDNPAFQQYSSITDLSPAKLAKFEKDLTTHEATMYITKDGHQLAGVKFHIAGKNDKGGEVDLTVDLRAATGGDVTVDKPSSPAPITDLVLQIQQDFPNLGSSGLLG